MTDYQYLFLNTLRENAEDEVLSSGVRRAPGNANVCRTWEFQDNYTLRTVHTNKAPRSSIEARIQHTLEHSG